ncbi:unnamed protein product [Linum tenue]|uniref:RNase H type-1 domain-containing protein n=1 Tax=Linum tenue TaxID=586396 RepID=A0AAV0P9I0_9ROSI|nr:unnamed protein product [Linum tenue]
MGSGSWMFTPREGNMAAHIMAHSTTSWNDQIVWLDNPPTFLVDQLELDNVVLLNKICRFRLKKNRLLIHERIFHHLIL